MKAAELRDRLLTHLRRMTRSPYVFLGSGLSRRYLGTYNWDGLLEVFAQKVGNTVEYYRGKAGGDQPLMGTLIAEDFYEVWWKSDDYIESRSRWADVVSDISSPLKIEVARLFEEWPANPSEPKLTAEERALLEDAVIDGIITTNYDRQMEDLFPKYRVFVGQDDLLFSNPSGVGEIYKIHGCCSRPNSLILTESDYNDFRTRNVYLAGKLLATFAEHPVVILGYSLRDPNIQTILDSVASCVPKSRMENLRDQLIFVNWEPNAAFHISETTRSVGDKILPIIEIDAPNFIPIFEALQAGQRRFPVHLLHHLREQLYELVRTTEPSKQVAVLDIEDDTPKESIELVIGVGIKQKFSSKGYAALQRLDLLKDLVLGDQGYDPEKVLLETLPTILKGTTYLPIFRYAKLAGVNENQSLTERLDPKLVSRLKNTSYDNFKPPKQYLKRSSEIRDRYKSFRSMVDDMEPRNVVLHATLLPMSHLKPEEVRGFLKEHWKVLLGDNSLIQTHFYKLGCALDYIQYAESVSLNRQHD